MYSTIAILCKSNFDIICRQYSNFMICLKQRMERYKDNLKEFIKQLLKSVDYIRECSDKTVEELSYYCKQEFLEKDKILFRAGDPIDRIYFIVGGKLNITITINSINIVVDTLYQGCSIGCNGVLGDFRHNFTARSVTNCSFYTLSKDNIQFLINS